jgi:hypothetical protein
MTTQNRDKKLRQVRMLLDLAMEISDSVSTIETDFAASISSEIYDLYHRLDYLDTEYSPYNRDDPRTNDLSKEDVEILNRTK